MTPPHRKLADYQYYMQHEDFKVGVAGRDQLNLRTKIARRLLLSEPQEFQQRMKEGAAEEQAAQMAKHEDALEGLPALDEEAMEEARARFSGLVGPLLDGLAAHTGYEISLLVDQPKLEEGKLDIECLSMHAGVTEAMPAMLDFSRADEAAYGEVMKAFSTFGIHLHVDEYCEEDGVRVDTDIPNTVAPAPGLPAPARAPIPGAPSPGDPMSVASHNLAPTPPTTTSISTAPSPAPPTSAADSGAFSGLTVAADTFTDEEIQALVNLGDLQLFSKFDFSDDLLSTIRSDGPVFPGLGLPMPNERLPAPASVGPPSPSDPYSTGFATPLSNELNLRLKDMLEDTREVKLGKLRTLDAPGIERENNAARNYYMINSLGLSNAQKEMLWGGTSVPIVKRKAGGQKKGRAGKKSRMEKELETHREEDGGSESDDESDTEPQVEREKRTHAASSSKESSPAAKATASRRAKEYGDSWTHLLSVWWRREEGAGFEGTTKSHAARMRPKEVGDWVSRVHNHMPQIGNAEEFGKCFWTRWIQINPAWRTEGRPMKREGEMSWVGLDIHRQNGFLNVLMCLKWWHDAMDVSLPDWEEAVDDITWVLERMNDGPESVPIPPTITNSPAPPPITGTAATASDQSADSTAAPATAIGQNDKMDIRPGISPASPQHKPRPLWARGGQNQQAPREGGLGDLSAAAHSGTEGLTQEELDEINADPDAVMDEEEK
ncbi:hypothetical protein MSAN_00226700 [Mycena sanguinolenta]|uniref:Uncharacterized protein n=1 Tax=Mycena sanguinolenta TaxID=230812 RepID=A0A8H7DMP8_9AGAR|nr:hypothetical protein MSAN_00226700 [Mycena sanguinolenta]